MVFAQLGYNILILPKSTKVLLKGGIESTIDEESVLIHKKDLEEILARLPDSLLVPPNGTGRKQ